MRTLRLFEDIDESTLYAVADFAESIPDKEEGVIEIASHGGLVFFGNASFQKIQEAQRRGCRFTAKVYGVAASSAADIVLTCDRIEMADTSAIMIHTAWNDAGRKDEGIRIANEAQLSVIHKRLPDYGEKDLKEDRWFTAKEALEAGLCDSIFGLESDSIQARLCAKYLAKGGNMDSEERKPVENQAEEVIEENQAEEVIEEKKDSPSVEDILERIGERLDEMDARLAKLEGAKAECGEDPERRDNARMKAVWEKINAVSNPASAKEPSVVAKSPEDALEEYKAKWPDLAKYINSDKSL